MTQTSIHVHLDYTIVDGGLDFLLGRARATVENKVAEECRVRHRLLP